jgi:guanosine-3',5'-bis(diphosphate) 3'-pyrophosphohydrolase
MADDALTQTQPMPVITPDAVPAGAAKSTTSASRRVRARLARRMTAQRGAMNPVLEPLVAVHRENHPKADVSILQRAYEVAEQRHADQLRQSGDPYITHPLAVANILAELGRR